MENKKSNKKVIVLISLIIVLALIIFGIKLFYVNFNLEAKYERKISKMSKDFYTNFYYKTVSKNRSEKDVKDFLSKFEERGVTIDLIMLKNYKKEYKKEISKLNNKKGELCNEYNTYAVIYPKSPYKQNSYKIDVKLDCKLGSSKK